MNIAKQARIVTKQLEDMIRNADVQLPEQTLMMKQKEKAFAGYNWQTYEVEPIFAEAEAKEPNYALAPIKHDYERRAMEPALA
jgi:hypothetical protein